MNKPEHNDAEPYFYINFAELASNPFYAQELTPAEGACLIKLIAFASSMNDNVYIPEDAFVGFLTLRDKCLKEGLLVQTKRPGWYKFTCGNVLYKHGKE